MSKVLLINGSPHAHGCTFTALGVVADELQKASIETEIVHVGHKDIRGCIGCYKCKEMGRCVFDKDMVNEVAKKFEEADGLVIGSPVYYAGANGTLVSFLNRLFGVAPVKTTAFDGAHPSVEQGEALLQHVLRRSGEVVLAVQSNGLRKGRKIVIW